MIGERHVLKDHAVIIFVERGPASVLTLHRQDPIDRALHRFALVASIWMFDAAQSQADHRAVIHIGIKLIVELEVPAARLALRILDLPVARLTHLLLQNPVSALY